MPETKTLFDLGVGEALKNGGMGLALGATHLEWQAAFEREGLRLIRLGGEFTSEHIVGIVGVPGDHPNAVGAAMNGLVRRHKLVLAGYRKGNRPAQHARKIAVWKAR